MANSNAILRFKFLVTGDSAVGKTALLEQYANARFTGHTQTTIEAELVAKSMTVRGKTVKVELWDTAGMETFLSLTRAYYRNADGCLVVFDVNRRETFESSQKWIQEAKINSGNPNLVVVLIGNKTDQDANCRRVTKEEAQILAAEHNIGYCEATATSFESTNKVFTGLADLVYQALEGETPAASEFHGTQSPNSGLLEQQKRPPGRNAHLRRKSPAKITLKDVDEDADYYYHHEDDGKCC